jgi:hypothetical protein
METCAVREVWIQPASWGRVSAPVYCRSRIIQALDFARHTIYRGLRCNGYTCFVLGLNASSLISCSKRVIMVFLSPSISIVNKNVKVKVILRLTVSQSLSLGVEPHLRFMTRYLLLFDSYGLVLMGRPL